MNSGILAFAALTWLLAGYRIYGRIIEKKIVIPDDNRETPANSINDGIDFYPAKPLVLFGHHFSSIAGAGPVLGPVAAALAFGWGGSILWILLGSVFIGAVHDYLSLMLSVRHGAKSVPDLAGIYIGPKARLFFLFFVWVTLVLVVAVFANVAASTLASTPEIVYPTIGIIPIAMLFGFLLNRMKMGLVPATVLSLALLFFLVYFGFHHPVTLPVADHQLAVKIWFIVLILYGLIASVLPVWLLLQPRDYLANWVLIIGMTVGFAGLFVTHPTIHAPAFVHFRDPTTGPMWPMLFIVIACGAVSGFHSLVAGGTTAKQLNKESNGKFIGYGGMLTEGGMAVLALMAVSAGLYWKGGSASAGVDPTLVFQHFFDPGNGGPIKAFGQGFGVFTAPFFGMTLGALFGITMLKTFVMTTLDTSVRLGRFITSEMVGGKLPFFRNRWIATFAVIIPAYFMGANGAFQIIWPVFGSANQLVAALVLLVITAFLVKTRKPSLYAMLPAAFMLVTTIGSLLWQFKVFMFSDNPKPGLGLTTILLLLLAGYVTFESVKELKNRSLPEKK